ncbi:MAG TPA: tRNA (guanosine(37)-N1)-methyltransferase TrmD [Anaerolineae bacterium]|nr:tRNA (guanosine(37)-N1)-methyltransferase TrmD [Anaerolineae bacterium]
MHIDVLTLFPHLITTYTDESILGRAQDANHLTIAAHNIRDYSQDKHRRVDYTPYGGGGGMILAPEPIFRATEAVLGPPPHTTPIILLTPQGRPFTQTIAQELSQHPHFLLLCGRYEGIDERVRQHLVTDEISIGDFVLTGGELGALIIIDAVTRLLPDVLGADNAAATDSFATGLLEGPHYTQPATYRHWPVPDVLRSGHAANIDRWRRQHALRRTWHRRPDLLLTAPLTEEDKQFLQTLADEATSPPTNNDSDKN